MYKYLVLICFLVVSLFVSAAALAQVPNLANLEPDVTAKVLKADPCPVKQLAALKAKQDSGAAEVVTPVNGTTLSDSSQDFTWTAGGGEQMYWIHAGSSQGGMDYYNQVQWATYGTVSGLPTDGSPIYVRLFTYFGESGWLYNDYVYTAASQAAEKAELIYPEDGDTLTGSFEAFGWTTGGGDGLYQLSMGAIPGGIDYFNQPLWATSVTATNLPTDGSTVYARLWTHFDFGWLFNDYAFTAIDQGGTKIPAVMTAPEDGSTLSGSEVAVYFDKGNGDGLYQVSVGSSEGGIEYFNQPVWDTDASASSLSVDVSGLPTDGSTLYFRVWTHFPSGWIFNDYVLVAFDNAGVSNPGELIDPADDSFLKATT